MKLIVEKISAATPEIRLFRLVHPDGAALPQYAPGAHVDVTGPTGITRQYSLCGHSADTSSYLVAVKREAESRGGSAALHERVSEGCMLEVGAPRNLFALAPQAPEHLLFGAGIGITPLLAMAYDLAARGERFMLHYFVRAPEHAAFTDLLSSDPLAPHVRFHYGVPPADLDSVVRAQLAQASAGAAAHVYTCGPAPFMEFVVAAASVDRPGEQIHLEHFQAVPVNTGTLDNQFELELASSGRVLAVPVGSTIVDVLAQVGITIDTSCREGICGTCVVPVLEGEPEHRDHCLSKKEKAANDQICACVSRSRSARLVLGL